ncbi:MAG: UDP-2,3-diacylglucosamine diphosphatase [Alistipes sp.]|nr:UDP-2,3-diacylglucosamine diphosphatase [Alistipes sp.]
MIYFVSDIHLGAGNHNHARRTEDAFCRWLDMVAKDATKIYLLGDIFDFWFEYRRVVPQGFVRVFGRLAELTQRGVEVVFYTGNHDMWCYDYLEWECGMRIVRRPRIEKVGGLNIHLAHGDNMNIKGQPMLRLMNSFFRSRTARVIFSWLIHPDLALKFGKWWSGKSRKSHGSDEITPASLNFLVDYAIEHKARHADVDAYIFGHMHYPFELRDDVTLMFLSDWSGDKAHYVTLDDNSQLELKEFDIDETVS